MIPLIIERTEIKCMTHSRSWVFSPLAEEVALGLNVWFDGAFERPERPRARQHRRPTGRIDAHGSCHTLHGAIVSVCCTTPPTLGWSVFQNKNRREGFSRVAALPVGW